MTIRLRVYGQPAPQGSHKVFNGRVVNASKKTTPWREAIVSQALRQGLQNTRMTTPVTIRVTFLFPRPQAHYGRRNGERYVKDNAPLYKAGTPDLDKLLRSTGDGLVQAGVLHDDDLIVEWHARKVYSEEPAGAVIEIVPVIATDGASGQQ